MTKIARVVLVAGLAIALSAGRLSAGPVVLDFEALRHVDDGFTVHGPEYSEDGFRLVATHPQPGNPLRFNTLGTLHPGFPGSTAVYQGVSLGEVNLTEVNGRPFVLVSIKLAMHPSLGVNDQPIDYGPFDVAFTGQRADGTTVTNTFRVDGFLTLKTYTFSGFTSLTSVKWSQGAGGPDSPTHAFDDVTVQAVPAPSSLVLALVSVALSVAGAMRRGRRAPAVAGRR